MKASWEALKEFPTPDGRPILSMDGYQKYRAYLFHHTFTKLIRIPKQRYDRSSSPENDPRWDIITDGMSCPQLFRDKNYAPCKQSDKKRESCLASQALSIVAQISIRDNVPINHHAIPPIFMNHLHDTAWVDKYYNLCAKALERRNAVISGNPTVLEHLLVKQKLQCINNNQIINQNDIEANIDLARINFLPRFTIACDYLFRDNNTDPMDKQRIINLCSYGHSLFKYDFKYKKIWKSMTYRAAWMSYLLSSKASIRYVTDFPDGHIKLVDLREDIIQLLEKIYSSNDYVTVCQYRIEDDVIVMEPK